MEYKFYDKHNKEIYEADNKDSEEGLLNAWDEVAEDILREDNPAGVREVYYKDMINDIKSDLVYVPEHIEKVKKEINDFLTKQENKEEVYGIETLKTYIKLLNDKTCSDDTLIDIFEDYEEYLE